MNSLPTRTEIEAIAPLIDSIIPPTPQYSWPLLNARVGAEVWVKHENHTPVGSFKVRGGVSYVSRLIEREPTTKGLILATRGNHGQSIAFAARRYNLKTIILIPVGNSPEKNAGMRALGAELIEHGEDFQAALVRSRELAEQMGLHWVPSFHPDLVLGISVSTLNFLQNVPELARVYVPIGLGSGICAMTAARDALNLKTQIIGVASESAPAIALSFREHRLVAHAASTRIADGLACSVPNPDALGFILRGVERIVTVSDSEVEEAMRAYFIDTHNAVEGAAGAALAAILREKELNAGARIGVVCTGGNIDRPVFARVLSQAP